MDANNFDENIPLKTGGVCFDILADCGECFAPLHSNLSAMSKRPLTLKQLEHNLKQPASNRRVAAKQQLSNTPIATLEHPESNLRASRKQPEGNLNAIHSNLKAT